MDNCNHTEKNKLNLESNGQNEIDAIEENTAKTPPRGQWGHQAEFILACLSYCVGYGNIWRFPYLCMRNGGGAFLIPYFVSLFLCGIPLFFLEMCLGQFSGLSPLHVWAIAPLFKGLGYSMVIMSFIISNYYNMVTAWVIYYLFKSFTTSLPWAGCDNKWNTPLCREDSQQILVNTSAAYSGHSINASIDVDRSQNPYLYSNISSSAPWRSATEEYWKFSVLKISEGITDFGDIRWELFGYLALGWFMIGACLCKGIKSLGKVVFVTALLPYVLLTVLLVRGLLLPGALNGIRFYIIPDWEKLLNMKVWVEACMQVFYSLGPGWGGIIVMSSYNKFNNNAVRDSIILPIVNGGTSLYAGFVVFTVIGFMAHSAGLQVQDISPGPGLVFIVYPEALLKMPISPLWSILFFLMLLVVGFDSQFGNVEVVLSSLQDSFPKLRKHKTLLTAAVCVGHLPLGMIYCTQAGMYYFQLVDWYMSLITVMAISMFECILVMWIYGHRKFYRDITLMLGYSPSIVWKVCWGLISPLMLLTAQVYTIASLSAPYYEDYTYPTAARGVGWLIAFCSAVPIPLCMIYTLLQQKGTLLQRLKAAVSPSDEWKATAQKSRSIDEKGNVSEKGVLQYTDRV